MSVVAPPEARVLEASRGLSVVSRAFAVEDAEIRAAEDGSTVRQFLGHASVTDTPYDIFGGPDNGGFTETIAAGAFRRALGRNPDVPLLINHEGQPYAATWNGTISLSEDDTGLRVEASIDTEYPDAQSFVRRLETGLLREMSFVFRVTQQEWRNPDGEIVPWWDMSGIDRRILNVDLHKGDVSVVNFGVNPVTDAALRSWTETLRELPRDELDEADIRDAYLYLRQMMDVNGDPVGEIAQALDTLLEGVEMALTPIDTSTWPTEAQDLLSTVVSADALVDQLLATLGIPDPDEDQVTSGPEVDETEPATVGGVLVQMTSAEPSPHPDLIAAQQRAVKRHAELVAATLQ